MIQSDYEVEVLDRIFAKYGDLPSDPYPGDPSLTWAEVIERSATAIWDFCDKNRDDFLCVMNFDEEVSPYSSTLLDNRPFRAK
jgi:hypothetical protein